MIVAKMAQAANFAKKKIKLYKLINGFHSKSHQDVWPWNPDGSHPRVLRTSVLKSKNPCHIQNLKNPCQRTKIHAKTPTKRTIGMIPINANHLVTWNIDIIIAKTFISPTCLIEWKNRQEDSEKGELSTCQYVSKGHHYLARVRVRVSFSVKFTWVSVKG